jgi:hypothetical protein
MYFPTPLNNEICSSSLFYIPPSEWAFGTLSSPIVYRYVKFWIHFFRSFLLSLLNSHDSFAFMMEFSSSSSSSSSFSSYDFWNFIYYMSYCISSWLVPKIIFRSFIMTDFYFDLIKVAYLKLDSLFFSYNYYIFFYFLFWLKLLYDSYILCELCFCEVNSKMDDLGKNLLSRFSIYVSSLTIHSSLLNSFIFSWYSSY